MFLEKLYDLGCKVPTMYRFLKKHYFDVGGH